MEFDINYQIKQGYKGQKKGVILVIGITTCKFIQFTSFFYGFHYCFIFGIPIYSHVIYSFFKNKHNNTIYIGLKYYDLLLILRCSFINDNIILI